MMCGTSKNKNYFKNGPNWNEKNSGWVRVPRLENILMGEYQPMSFGGKNVTREE
jgi:hypothetical protein